MRDEEQFYSTANELDELTEDGAFGEKTKELVSKRETMPRNDYLYEILLDWNESDQIGKKDVKKFIKKYLELYFNAFKVDSQGTVDILTDFWFGTKELPELECFNSYLESVHLFANVKTTLNELSKKEKVTLSEKRTARSLLLNSYSKNVELANKILAFLICIQEIGMGKKHQINILNTYRLPLFKKIKVFNELTNDKYTDLINSIDRRVRNAEAHLNVVFDDKTNSFVLRSQTRKKVIRTAISLDDMLYKVVPSIGWFIQGYIYSGTLLVLYVDDKQLYNKAMESIVNN